MDIEKYLKMNSEELFSFLITDIIADPLNGETLLKDLSKTERYKNDYELRTTVETARCIIIGIKGQPTKLIPLATNLIQTTSALKMPQLEATNWNLLGIAYSQSGLYEKAVECYHKAIKLEKSYGLHAISSIAYNNIAMVYIIFGLHEKSIHYFNLAVETLKAGGEDQPRYKSKLLLYISNLITAYCRNGTPAPAPSLFAKIEKIGTENMNTENKAAYYFALMYYHFLNKNYEKGKEAYYLAKENTNSENKAALYALLGNYMNLCENCNFDLDFYKDELLAAEELQEANHALANVLVYKQLRQYYKKKGDREKYFEIMEKYVDFLEEDSNVIRKRQSESLLLVDNMIIKYESADDIAEKNTELELIAREAISHKNSLQKAYLQIETIGNLGKKLTSSLKLDEVVHQIYNIISDNLPMDIFFLLMIEKDKLRSISYYEDGVIQPEFILDLKGEPSFILECIEKNKIISTHDEEYQALYKKRKIALANQTNISSAIYLPLNAQGKVIGVCSVQERNSVPYTEDEKKFLEDLLPYLSIALNNAVHSRDLEREIQSHLLTQAELQAANIKLKKLSSLDGLTQISSRRAFDSKISTMMLSAAQKQDSITIFMLDIDNFKLYNDNYGHFEGDEALKSVALVFRDVINQYKGLSARFGGEEFIGACEGLTPETAFSLAEKIRTKVFSLNIPHAHSSHKKISVSIGIAFCHLPSPEKKSDIMRLADSCLYDAKEGGRNKTVMKTFYSDQK